MNQQLSHEIDRAKKREWRRLDDARIKTAVLTHYGKNGTMKCCWEACEVVDPDMLSIDHVNDDGAKSRADEATGGMLYAKLIRRGFPEGFQTLCHNHQWKKEIRRNRANSKATADRELIALYPRTRKTRRAARVGGSV